MASYTMDFSDGQYPEDYLPGSDGVGYNSSLVDLLTGGERRAEVRHRAA